MRARDRGMDKKVSEIRKVKATLAEVNKELNNQQTSWQKIATRFGQWHYAISSACNTIINGISGMQAAIQSYADMDTSMADTQKFTGMSADDVKQLNEAFKQMDTRTSREDLNALAAAAGRLGKNSVEDVLGFVRAGDQIGVAMDELGRRLHKSSPSWQVSSGSRILWAQNRQC